MAIDIRATVTCSLGTLISGSISDDYIQGSGLVKTRGSVEISALITPAIGTVVTFAYTKGGVTRSIPRKLRVMSSFADPFRRTTKVELGCKLTYLSDLKDPLDLTAFDDPGNAGLTEDDARIVTLPIRAASVMAECLTKLGITASSSPLTNKFSIASFDLSAGYVQVLNDLLVSESYCGYLDTNEVLQVFSLDQDSGSGPVLTSSDIVDLGPIGVGALPGEAVTVSYSSLKLRQPPPQPTTPEEEEQEEERLALINWEKTVTTGSVDTYYINYSKPDVPNTIFTQVYTGITRTFTATDYVTIKVIDSEGASSIKEVPKLRRTTVTGPSISRASSIATAYLSQGTGNFNNVDIILSDTYENFTYNDKGDVTESTVSKYEPEALVLNASQFDWVYDDGDFVASYALMLTEYSVTTTSIIARYRKDTVTTYLLYGFTQQGEQAVALFNSLGVVNTLSDALEFAATIIGNPLVHANTTETVGISGATSESRPPAAERTNAALADGGDPNNGWRTESQASLELAVGSATAQRRIELSMPYAPDDTFSGPSGGPFTATASDAPAKANRYGRVQNRLLLGNRSGMNLQLAPDRLPTAPFSPLYIQANGLSALYRANGTSWAFDSNGIVCSIDALFWGAVGGTGTFWFPVAPGITTLPTAPAVVDTSPTAVIGNIATVGAAPQTALNTAFPTAVSGDGVQDQNTSNFWVYDGTTWDDVGSAPGPTTEATNVVLPYNEIAIYEGRLRLTADVTKFDYALTLLTVVPPLSLRLEAEVFDVTLLAAAGGSFATSGQAVALLRRYSLAAATTAFAATGFSAGSIRDYTIGTNAGTFTAAGQDAALRADRAPLAAEAGTFTAAGQDAALRAVQPLSGDVGAFALTGEAANFIRSLRLPADATSYTVTGSAAGLFTEDYFSNWATQTYGYETLVYPSWWTD